MGFCAAQDPPPVRERCVSVSSGTQRTRFSALRQILVLAVTQHDPTPTLSSSQPHEQEPEPFLHPTPGVPVTAWPQVDPAPRLPSWICISLGYIGKYVPSLLISLHCVFEKLQKLSARESFPNALF